MARRFKNVLSGEWHLAEEKTHSLKIWQYRERVFSWIAASGSISVKEKKKKKKTIDSQEKQYFRLWLRREIPRG